MWKRIRHCCREAFFQFLRRVGETDDARAIAAETLKGLQRQHPSFLTGMQTSPQLPYLELGRARTEALTSHRSDIVIITARFRSGSTLLWNLFRHIGDCTAYFEPFHHLRPFDQLTRTRQVAKTHRNVSDYWQEYENLEILETFFRENWNYQNFLMGPDFWDPAMKRYIELLIEKSPGRPILQFNRIDFRLPWFRKNFPQAKIVHLYRHPRDQWCSFLTNPQSYPKYGKVEDFTSHDHYFINDWVKDLEFHFPFLDWKDISHPYQMFYYLWKLSYIFGIDYADYHISFEKIVKEPFDSLSSLFRFLYIDHIDLNYLKALIAGPKLGKWKEYADDGWFRKHEEKCETVMEDFLHKPPVETVVKQKEASDSIRTDIVYTHAFTGRR